MTENNNHADRNLAMELVRATEAAAIASGPWVGAGDKNRADGAAVDAMRYRLSTVHFNGTVVIGEGEKDKAPMLFNGEVVGDGIGPNLDIAVDPIDGTRLTALGMDNALSVIAVADGGSMFDPSAVFYMEKLVTGPEAAEFVDLRLPVKQNLHLVAKAQGKNVSELTVCVLDRPRHAKLIEEIRNAGARTRIILDGDVAGAIAACREGTGVDTADAEREKALAAGHDLDRILTTDDLVTSDNCFFAATGITDGKLLRGVRYGKNIVTTQSLVMRSSSGTVRIVEAEHRLSRLREILSHTK